MKETHNEHSDRHAYARLFFMPAIITGPVAEILGALDNIQKWLDFGLEKGQIRGIKSGLACIMGVGPGIFRQREEARLTIANVLSAHYISREINWEIIGIPRTGKSIRKEDER